MLYPLRNITMVISRVIFPAFSKIQHDNSKLRDAYIKITNSIAIITFPMMAGIAFVSFNFTEAFFGVKWDACSLHNYNFSTSWGTTIYHLHSWEYLSSKREN